MSETPDKVPTTKTTMLLPADLLEWIDRRRLEERPQRGRSPFIVALLYDMKHDEEQGIDGEAL